MTRLVLPLIVLAGCSNAIKDAGSGGPGLDDDTDTAVEDTAADADTDADADADADADSDSDADTDADADTDTDTDADTDTGTASCPAPSDFTWVVDTLVVGTSSEGVDLDGDGTVDNVLAFAKSSLDASLADTMATSADVIVLQLWNLDDWCDDADVMAGFLTPTDTDDDLTDNHSGTEVFDAGAEVDASGYAVLQAATALSGGDYTVSIPSATMEVGGYTLVSATPLVVEGTATDSVNVGVMGFGLSVEAMVPIAADNDIDRETVEALADLDTDGDGTRDALSIAFVFTSVPCGI